MSLCMPYRWDFCVHFSKITDNFISDGAHYFMYFTKMHTRIAREKGRARRKWNRRQHLSLTKLNKQIANIVNILECIVRRKSPKNNNKTLKKCRKKNIMKFWQSVPVFNQLDWCYFANLFNIPNKINLFVVFINSCHWLFTNIARQKKGWITKLIQFRTCCHNGLTLVC